MPTTKKAAETFGVSVPYVMEAIADLKADGEHLTTNGNSNGQLPFIPDINDLWSHMDDDEREMFAREHLDSIWDAFDRITAA